MKAWVCCWLLPWKLRCVLSYHSTALLLLDRASQDGAETISVVTKWTVSI